MKAWKSEGPATVEEALGRRAEAAEALADEMERHLADLTEILCGERPVGVMPETTKDAARALVADNAALLHAWHEAYDHNNFRQGEDIAGTIHPGSDMLEQHAKALVHARNEGLERAAAWLRANPSPICQDFARCIEMFKEPEQ